MKEKDAVQIGNGNNPEDFDLSLHDAEYAAADVSQTDWDPVPDGKYVVRVEDAELTRAQLSGNPMLKWRLRILSDSYDGRLLWRYNLIVTPDNLWWLKKDLRTCGLELNRISDLPANLNRLIDVRIEVTKRTKNGKENVYFNRRVVTDENIPF